MSVPSYQRTQREGTLTFSTKLRQGIGAIPDTVKNWVFNTFVLLYYNQILGVDAFDVSLVLGVAVIFDAITDPLVGSLTDNARSRWGRRHPFMLLASLPLGLSIYFVFVPPSGLSDLHLALWLLFFVIATRTCMTLFQVPWSAMAAELSDDYNERTSVMSYRFAVGWTIGVSFPIFVFSFVMPSTEEFPVAQLNPAGYPMMAFCAAVLLLVGSLAATLLTVREIPYLRQHDTESSGFKLSEVFADAKRALETRQFAIIFLVILCSAAISGSTRNIDIYMTTFFWGFTTADLRWFAISAIGAVLAFPLIATVQKRWDKKDIMIATAVIGLFDGMFMISLRFLGVLPENGDPMLLVILVTAGILAAGLAVVLGIIFASVIADILDLHELRTGHRQEAMFYAGLSFSGKVSSGLGIVMGGFIISAIQFPTGLQPSEVDPDLITRLGIVVGLVIPLFHLIPIYLVTKFEITREVHADIKAQLEAKHSA